MAAEKLLQRQEAAVSNRAYDALMWDAKLVALALNVGQRTLWRWIAAGTFPPPDLSIGAKIRRWRRQTVLDWIEQHTEGK
jgi:predicted DNA-binding transcriptional regulator AlpA